MLFALGAHASAFASALSSAFSSASASVSPCKYFQIELSDLQRE